MAKITFITRDNQTIETEDTVGTVMELAVEHEVPGIEGECGGVMSCATCHVHVDPEYFKKVGKPGPVEADMLELDDNVTEYSRLSCQIRIKGDLDGMVLHVANEA